MEFVKEVLEGLYLVTGSLSSGVDVTAAIIASDGEAIFFDSLYYPNETVRLMEIAGTKELDPIALVNTHWHIDHTAGNNHFPLHTVSQEKCVELMKTELPLQLNNAREKIGPIEVKYPDWTFENKLKLTVGDKELTLLHLPGHTPDSIIGLVEKDHVLIAGDTVMELPFVTYGNSEALLSSLRSINELDVKMILQGHGGLCEKAKLDDDMEYLEKMRTIVVEGLTEGKTVEEVQAMPIEQFLPEERIGKLSDSYKERIHRANLQKIFKEFASAKP